MRLRSRSDVVLYLWDYFYVSKYPQQGDEKVTVQKRRRDVSNRVDPAE